MLHIIISGDGVSRKKSNLQSRLIHKAAILRKRVQQRYGANVLETLPRANFIKLIMIAVSSR